MGFARAASRAFSRITPKAWRGKKKTENFDLPRNHSESKQSYVNLVGSHRDAKGKVRKYDLISDQDTGDLYVANYSAGKTKYIHSGNVIKDHTAVDFGTFENKQRAKVQGQYSGLDATVKYLKDNGINVEGLDRTMGTAKSPRFTGSLIDPRSRHTIGSGYGPNTDSHRNYVPLDALNDLQKGWRATQNKPGDPPSYGSGPAPKQPNGPDKPSGPRFKKRKGDPFSDASGRQSPPDPPKNGPSGTGTTFGPVPSQNQAGKGWRAKIRVSPTTETGSAVRMPREQPQDIVSEMKALGFAPQTQAASPDKPKRSRTPKPVVEGLPPEEAATISAHAHEPNAPLTKQQRLELLQSLKSSKLAKSIVANSGRGTPGPVPNPKLVKAVQDIPIPKLSNLDNVAPENQRNVSDIIQAQAWANSDATLKSAGLEKGKTSREDDILEYSDKNVDIDGQQIPYGDINLSGSVDIADLLIQAAQDADPRVRKELMNRANGLVQRAATLDKQKKIKSGEIASNLDAEIANANSLIDPRGIVDKSMVYDPESGKMLRQTFADYVDTGITDQTLDAYDNASYQFNIKPDMTESQKAKTRPNISGVGGSIRNFLTPSHFENPDAPAYKRLDQIPDWQDKIPADTSSLNKVFDLGNVSGERNQVGMEKEIEAIASKARPDAEVYNPPPLSHEDAYIQDIASTIAMLHGTAKSEDTLRLAGRAAGSSHAWKNLGINAKQSKSQINASENAVYDSENSLYKSISQELEPIAGQRVSGIDKGLPVSEQRKQLKAIVEEDLMAKLQEYSDRLPPSVVEQAKSVGATNAANKILAGNKSTQNVIDAIENRDKINAMTDDSTFQTMLENVEPDSLERTELLKVSESSRQNMDRYFRGVSPRESAPHVQPMDESVLSLDNFDMPEHVKEFVGDGGQAYFLRKPKDNADTPVPFSEIGSMDKSMSPENANSDTQGTWIIDDGEDLWELDHFDPSSMRDVRDPERASMLRKAIELGLATPF
jgi:hypothetical protein